MSDKQYLMTLDEAAQRLAEYIRSLPDFVYREVGDPYDHIGCTIADAVLQPQRDYRSFVTPKTERIREKWSSAKTISQLVGLLERVPASVFLDWEDSKDSGSWLGHRVQRFCDIVFLFKSEGIETEGDLKSWLQQDSNLGKLYNIWGVGQKTVNYFGSLVGLPWVAIDSRLGSFLGAAGIPTDSYSVAAQRDIVCRAADLLSVGRGMLDHSIWYYVGEKKSARNANERTSKGPCHRRVSKNQSDFSLSA